MNEEKKEGYYNQKHHTYLHITENAYMDCCPKSYKYILDLEKHIKNLQEENKKYNDLYDELLKQYSKESTFCKIILEKLKGDDNE